MHDISLCAEPGQKNAFVDATGAGKMTITNQIDRFYDIGGGKIRYDGINIEKIKKSDLRRSLEMVLQDVNLFTGTVMENLKYGNPDATDEECVSAAKLANADGFIRMLQGVRYGFIGRRKRLIARTETTYFYSARCGIRSSCHDFGRSNVFNRYTHGKTHARRHG